MNDLDKTVKDFYPNMLSGVGIFTQLNAKNVPWAEETEASILNIAYYGHSANKLLSPLCLDIIDMDTKEDTIANIVYALYSNKWDKTWNVLNIVYSPLENYSMIETSSENGTNNKTSSDSANVTHTTNVTDTGTVNDSGSNNNNNSVYGFNSSDAVPSEQINSSDNNTTTRNLATSQSGNESRSDDYTETGGHNVTTNKTRSGNIGVTTSQQMAQSEIELRKYNYFQSVFDDIDKIIALYIY